VLWLAILSPIVACRTPSTPELDPIRIGWQVPWATQGQLAQVLQRTNVLALEGIRGDFKGFSYGGPLNEAAMAGQVDLIFTADQPAATLLARGGKWTIVARLMYNRTALYVPPRSPVRTLTDLKGKRVGMPFGAAAQRIALQAIRDAGLDPASDIRPLNLDIYEQNAVVQAGDGESWRGFDALVGFDPTPAIFEARGLARMLHVGRAVSVVLVSDEYLARHPEASQRVLMAYIRAWQYYAANVEQANAWFQEGSRLSFDRKVLDVCGSVEPNVSARSLDEIRPVLSAEDLTVLQDAARFVRSLDARLPEIDVLRHVDQTLVQGAMARLKRTSHDLAAVTALAR
jgi:ABC-type nitrate/sulfonate/bicarbonate transport system substrate-binding protein